MIAEFCKCGHREFDHMPEDGILFTWCDSCDCGWYERGSMRTNRRVQTLGNIDEISLILQAQSVWIWGENSQYPKYEILFW